MGIMNYIQEYVKADYVPMHMPGAKRNPIIAQDMSLSETIMLDITEIDGLDNMHNADGIIKESFDRAARMYGARESLYLVNGSTAGILAAICGTTNKNDTVIVARNCHCSVYNAITLQELNPVYIIPSQDPKIGIFNGVTLEDVIRACESVDSASNRNPDSYRSLDSDSKLCYGKRHIYTEDNRHNIENGNMHSLSSVACVILTSPTYEGNVSDIRNIAEYLHKRGIPLIVDEAHGAHFTFHNEFPESAVSAGADIVINSLHKTLPVLTQGAIIHLNGELINYAKVKRYWNMFQTTSPSYILMSSIDKCFTLLEEQGDELFDLYVERLHRLRESLNRLHNIKLVETNDHSKIILACYDGRALYDTLLKDYHIQLEMASFRYVIAMTSIADTEEYYDRFGKALYDIDGKLDDKSNSKLDDKSNGKLDDKSNGKLDELSKPAVSIQLTSDRKTYNANLMSVSNKCYTSNLGNIRVIMKPSEAVFRYENHGGRRLSVYKSVDYKKSADTDDSMTIDISDTIDTGSDNSMTTNTNETVDTGSDDPMTIGTNDTIDTDIAKSYICAQQVLIYPPGIPVICPGELVTAEVIDIIVSALEHNLEVIGLDEDCVICL